MTTGVTIEYHGQIVSGAVILRSLGFLRRVWIPVKGGCYQLVWVPRWRVLSDDAA